MFVGENKPPAAREEKKGRRRRRKKATPNQILFSLSPDASKSSGGGRASSRLGFVDFALLGLRVRLAEVLQGVAASHGGDSGPLVRHQVRQVNDPLAESGNRGRSAAGQKRISA